MKILLLTMLLLVSGANAKAGYYDSFVFGVKGSCHNPDHLWFHQATSWFRTDLGRDDHGRMVYADFDVQLLPAGKFWMHYSEIAITHTYPNGDTEGDVVFDTIVEGNWGIYGNQLALGGFLTATPVEIHDHGGTADGFRAKFFNAIHDSRLKQTSVIFGAADSKIGPLGMSVSEYCHQ